MQLWNAGRVQRIVCMIFLCPDNGAFLRRCRVNWRAAMSRFDDKMSRCILANKKTFGHSRLLDMKIHRIHQNIASSPNVASKIHCTRHQLETWPTTFWRHSTSPHNTTIRSFSQSSPSAIDRLPKFSYFVLPASRTLNCSRRNSRWGWVSHDPARPPRSQSWHISYNLD